MSSIKRFICCHRGKDYEVSRVQSAESTSSAHDDAANKQVRSLSKVDSAIVTISGATVEDTQTDNGMGSVKAVRGSCHLETEEPQVLFVYDNYPPGFDYTSLKFFNKTLYDYEFSTELVTFEDDIDKSTKNIVIQDSAAFEAALTNASSSN